MSVIIGIDPGLGKTGWGVIKAQGQRLSYLGCGSIHSDAQQPLGLRLQCLHEALRKVILTYQPVESALEETFVNRNPLSSLKLGHARGAIMLTLGLEGLVPYEYSATRVKKSVVGVGRAEKQQVAMMVKQLLPAAVVTSEDAADALAVAICHSHHVATNRKWENI